MHASLVVAEADVLVILVRGFGSSQSPPQSDIAKAGCHTIPIGLWPIIAWVCTQSDNPLSVSNQFVATASIAGSAGLHSPCAGFTLPDVERFVSRL
jgi:hypothetical protein